ncbi:MAG: IPT/TIG domain-containing protein [Terriglobia bacterium]
MTPKLSKLLGDRGSDSTPRIERVQPSAAIPGGEVFIHGAGLARNHQRPLVKFGDSQAPVLVASDQFIVARVPEGALSGGVRVETGSRTSDAFPIEIGVQIADNLHPVTNPAVDAEGNIYVTFSGSRGQKVPISVYKIDRNYNVKPFLSELMNATGLAFDRDARLYVSSRHAGVVYHVSPAGARSVYAEGMGIATGIAFDEDENLYVGDRSGTIFKVGRDRQILVFATLEPSVAAYHLAFGPDGLLYVTGPTTSSFDSVYRVSPEGKASVFYRGLGRPQGLAFDEAGMLYVVASLHGRRGVVRLTPDAQAEVAISGPNLVGLAFAHKLLLLATTNALYHMNWPTAGKPLLS